MEQDWFSKHHIILDFIRLIRESHSSMVDIFTKGSCLNFSLILSNKFEEVIMYYNSDHIISKIGSKYYDITGEVSGEGGYLDINEVHSPKTLQKLFKEMYNGEFTV